jgi:hypothetical protein
MDEPEVKRDRQTMLMMMYTKIKMWQLSNTVASIFDSMRNTLYAEDSTQNIQHTLVTAKESNIP